MGPTGTDILVLAVLEGASTEEVVLVRTTCRSLLSFLGRTVFSFYALRATPRLQYKTFDSRATTDSPVGH